MCDFKEKEKHAHSLLMVALNVLHVRGGAASPAKIVIEEWLIFRS
jgi:hypothetical protein